VAGRRSTTTARDPHADAPPHTAARAREAAAVAAFALFVGVTVAVNAGVADPLPYARIACRWRMFTSVPRERALHAWRVPRGPAGAPAREVHEPEAEARSWWASVAYAREPKLRDNVVRFDFVRAGYASYLCRRYGADAASVRLEAAWLDAPDAEPERLVETPCARP
jgi:hypothetical protein